MRSFGLGLACLPSSILASSHVLNTGQPRHMDASCSKAEPMAPTRECTLGPRSQGLPSGNLHGARTEPVSCSMLAEPQNPGAIGLRSTRGAPECGWTAEIDAAP